MDNKESDEKMNVVITEEEVWQMISNQVSSHEHMQSQAQGILRFIIAGIAIIGSVSLQNFFTQ